jgi:hypothetical protein
MYGPSTPIPPPKFPPIPPKKPDDGGDGSGTWTGTGGGTLGPFLIPAGPTQELDSNVQEAENYPADYWWFYNKVHKGADWDYNTKNPVWENFGNYNYGKTGAAASIPEWMLLWAAGVAQWKDGTSQPQWGGFWTFQAPFGDDPNDQYWIQQGYNSYGLP